jgi:glycosyltransferase involved in cell wall biosynthesis
VTIAPRIVVCVPARNEAERLPVLLDALSRQRCPATILVALNNTTDSSVEAIETARRRHPGLDVEIDETIFPLQEAHAGSARRRAMDVGARLAGRDGILITTDADTRPSPDWIAENVAALERLTIVGGRIVLDDAEDIAVPIRTTVAVTGAYWSTVRAIEDAIDPVPWDPPPRHGDHTGASLALRVVDYMACGGVPRIASGEDRALVQAICARGGRLGHPPQVWTRVSARTVGRAQSGMAEDMARLARDLQHGAPTMLPHYRHWEQRARWRRTIRERFGSAEVVVREAALAPMPCDMALAAIVPNDHVVA